MIAGVKLVNFKCFAAQELGFAPLTLLTGLNGSGKSSVVQALLVLRQSHDQRLLAENRLALNGDLIQLGRASDALYDRAEHEQITIGVRFASSALEVRVRYENGAEVLEAVAPSPLPSGLSSESLFTDALRYLGAERMGPRTVFSLSEPALRRMNVGTKGEYAAQFIAVFGDRKLTIPGLLHERAASAALRDQVEAWLSHMSPGVRIEAKAFPDIDVVQLAFRFSRQDDVSEAFRPTNVGFGLTYTLPVLVALHSAPPGALVIVENPEAHLHPNGQALMGEMLARAAAGGVQVLCETHSDHVLNGVRVAVAEGRLPPDATAVHFFARSDDGAHEVQSPKMQRNGRLDSWPKGFFDQWDRSLEDLLRLEES
jgi:predicted ATPase